jgi:PRTRC genetic system protein E
MAKTKNKIDKSFLREWKGFSIYDETVNKEKNRISVHPGLLDEFPEEVYEFSYSPEVPSNPNKAIEEAKDWINKLKRCRVCGCTEYNCKQCIEKDGHACHWVEEDLCSSRKEEPVVKVTDSRAINNIPSPNNTDMNFFEQLAALGHVDLTMRIMQKNDKLTIGIDLGLKSTGIKPINITGTPAEIDGEFFTSIIPKVNEIRGLVSNLDEVKEEAIAKASSKTYTKKETSKSKPTVKPAAKEKVEKPKAEKKAGKTKAVKDVAEEVKSDKPDLFANIEE